MEQLRAMMAAEAAKNAPPPPPPQPAIEYVKEEPKAGPESPGGGDWKANLEHIYAHLVQQCVQDKGFAKKIGQPKFGRIHIANMKEDDDGTYLLSVSVLKAGETAPKPRPKPKMKQAAAVVKAANKKPTPPPEKPKEEPKPKPKPKPKPEPKPQEDPYFVTEEYECEGTLKPWEAFNSERDCEILRKAMKGMGTDERAIIDIMGYRSVVQRQEVVTMFKTMFGKDLRDELAGETSGNFKRALKALCLGAAEYDASEVKRAIKGLGTDEDALIEILCTRTNAQIKVINETYEKLYDKSMQKDIEGDTSGNFRKVYH